MEIFLLSFHCLDSIDYDRGRGRGYTIYNVMYEITIYQMMSSRVYHHFRIDIFYASKSKLWVFIYILPPKAELLQVSFFSSFIYLHEKLYY